LNQGSGMGMGNKNKTTKKIARLTARELRKKQTKAEELFWQKVRNRKLLGLRFLRQRSLYYHYYGKLRYFISDFYCHQLKLVVEIDGGIHELQEEYDQKRSEILECKNYHVLRFKNEDIYKDINIVLLNLKNDINKLGMDLPSPQPLP
jgi:very-short-patch-repair endonuclease